MNSNRRVLVIGMDGFEQTIADGLIAQGRMPNLAAMTAEGACVPVDHGAAKRTGLAWEHFASGLSPKGAQRWSAVTFDPDTYTCRQLPTQLTPFPASLPVSTVVFDPPYFDLQRAPLVQGVVCWGAHDPGTHAFANPPGLSQEIESRFGAYPAEPFIYGYTWASKSRTEQMAADIVRATNLRTEIATWLFNERLPDWQLGVVVISELHSAIEALWHGVDSTHPLHHEDSANAARQGIEGVFEAVDVMLGRFRETFSDSDLLLFSFHGMGANDSDVASMALLPELLYRRNGNQPLINASNDDATALPLVGEDESWSAHVRSQFLPPKKSMRKRVNERLQAGRRNRSPDNDADNNADDGGHPVSWMPSTWYSPYWQAMPAFALPSFYDGQIRINVQGREANGVVATQDYDALCQNLAEELRACTNPRTNEPAVREVILTHPGQPLEVHATEADIIILWHESPLALRTASGEIIGPLAYRRPGGHTGGDGFALWVGDEFKAGAYPRVSAFDVVPTLVEHLCGADALGCDGTSHIDLIRTRS